MENFAVILKENGSLHFGPKSLGPLVENLCRIKVQACGVCSSDIFRAFDYGAYNYPLIMGHEFSGEIIEIGKKISDFKKGDHVAVFPLIPCGKCKFCQNKKYNLCNDYDYFGSRRDGGFSQFVDVPSWNLLPLPERVDFKSAACLEPLSVTLHALNKFENLEGLLIIGGGFLGLLAIKILKIKNPKINLTLIDRNREKCELAQTFGAESIYIADKQTRCSFVLKNESKYPNILEASGAPINFCSSLKLASPKGKIVWMGNITDDLNLKKAEISSILRKELQIMGTWNSNYKTDWEEAISLLERGLKIEDLNIYNTSLEKLPEALNRLYQHKKGIKKFPHPKVMVCG